MAGATLAFFLAPRRIVAPSAAEERHPTRAEEVQRGQVHQADRVATPRHPVVIQVADQGQVEGRYPDNNKEGLSEEDRTTSRPRVPQAPSADQLRMASILDPVGTLDRELLSCITLQTGLRIFLASPCL